MSGLFRAVLMCPHVTVWCQLQYLTVCSVQHHGTDGGTALQTGRLARPLEGGIICPVPQDCFSLLQFWLRFTKEAWARSG